MACIYSPGIADLIQDRWDTYPYTRADVIDMIARISRSDSKNNIQPVTNAERELAERLVAACD